MRWVVFSGSVLLASMAGCSSRPQQRPPLLPDPPALDAGERPSARADEHHDAVPRVIRRIVAEQRDELADVHTLAIVVGDARGRERALREATGLSDELTE